MCRAIRGSPRSFDVEVTLKERQEKEFETTAVELRETLEPRAPRCAWLNIHGEANPETLVSEKRKSYVRICLQSRARAKLS